MQRFHEIAKRDFINGEEGDAAFKYIRSKLEDDWDNNESRDHPMRKWVSWASKDQYDRLILLARKLKSLDEVPNANERIKRLTNQREFDGAMAELEIAFRLKIAGFFVSFVPESQENSSPDLKIEINGRKYWIEVSSVAPRKGHELEDILINRLLNLMFQLSISHKLMLRFSVVAPPRDKKDLQSIITQLNEASTRAINERKFQIVPIEGKMIVYIAPPEDVDKIPEDLRLGSYKHDPQPKQHLELLLRKIRKKGFKKYSQSDKGFLAIVDPFCGAKEVKRIMDSPGDDLRMLMRTFPDLMGMALIIQSGLDQNELQNVIPRSDRKGFDFYSLPHSECEGMILWENEINILPNEIREAFLAYPRNLELFIDRFNKKPIIN